jgi:hypothetical protein
MNDLVTWLSAQLDEDERIAVAAASLCGCHGPAPEWDFADDDNGGRIAIRDNPHPDIRQRLTGRWNRSYNDLFIARHIAHHDPARVLAEVAAKQEVLDHAKEWAATLRHTPDGWTEQTATAYRMAMEWTLRLLAAPYADRPGYREEWRP